MNLASAFVELRSSSSTFATEARAQINAVLDGISAQVALGIDASRLREEVNTGMAAAVAGQKGSVPVFIDASGMRSRLVADVDAAKAGVHLEIPVEADTRYFTEEIAQIEAKVQGLRELKANIPVGIEAAHLDSQMQAEVTKAKLLADAARIRIAAGIDEGDLDADLAKVPAKARAIEDASKIEIKVDTDESPLDRLSGALGRVKGDAGGLDGVLSALKFGAIAAEAGNAAAGLVSLGAGGFAAISALAPLTGLLGAIPAGLAGIGAGFGVFKLSLGGVGDALKALDKDHASAGRSAASQADAEEAAAARVKSAQDSLGDALRRQDQASEDGAKRVLAARESLSTAVEHQALVQAQGARNVEAAERTLASTQAASIQTQRDLTSAREAAARQLDDLREKVENQSLTEAEAAQRLEQARADAAKAPPPGRRTFEQSQQDARDRRAAVLAVKRAEEDLERVRTDGARSAADLQEAESKGVEGSDAVVAAKERESKAQTDEGLAIEALRLARATATREDVAAATQVVKAQDAITEAQRQNGRAQEDAARSVERASASLESAIRAQEKATDSVSSSATAAADALAALSPAGRDFALFLHGLKPDLDSLKADVSASFLPGLQVGIEKMLTLAPVVHDALVGAGAEFGSFFSRLGALAGSTSFKIDLASILGNANEFMGKLGEATLNVVSGLKDIAVAAEPMVSGLGDLAIHISEVFKNWAEGGRNSGELQAFFQNALDTLKQVLSIGGHLFQLLGDLGKAAAPLGRSLLGHFDDLLSRLHDIASTVSGQASLKNFFDDAMPPLLEFGRLIGDLLEDIVTLGHENMPILTSTLQTLRQDVLPVILDLLRTAAPGAGAIVNMIRTIMQNKDFTDALHNAVKAFVDLISSLADNKGFINGIVAGFRDILDIVSTVAGWITWINENVPGAGHLIGDVLGGLVAIAALAKFSNIFSPLIEGAKSLIGLIASAIKKLAEMRTAQAVPAGGGAATPAAGAGFLNLGLASGALGLGTGAGPQAVVAAGVADLAFKLKETAGAFDSGRSAAERYGSMVHAGLPIVGEFSAALDFGIDKLGGTQNATGHVIDALGHLTGLWGSSGDKAKAFGQTLNSDVTAVFKSMSEAVTTHLADIKTFNTEVAAAFNSSTDIVAAFGGQTEVTAGDVEKFFADQKAQAQSWADNLRELSKAGLDEGLLKELEKAGPKVAPLVAAMLEEVKTKGVEVVNKSRADNQAILTNLLADIDAKKPEVANRAGLIGALVDTSIRSGVFGSRDQALGAINGLVADSGNILNNLPPNAFNAGQRSAGFGGLAGGLASMTGVVQNAIVNHIINPANAEVARLQADWKVAGFNAGIGLAQGIIDSGQVTKEQAKKIVGGIIQDTGNILDARSPSRVFMRFGHSITDGLSLGITNGLPLVREAMRDLHRTMSALTLPDVTLPKVNVPAVQLATAAIAQGPGVAAGPGPFDTTTYDQRREPGNTVVHRAGDTYHIVAPDPTLVPSEITRQTRSKRWLVGASKAPDRGTR